MKNTKKRHVGGYLGLAFATVTAFFMIGCTRPPDAERIKADLIGQYISSGGGIKSNYEVSSMSQFQSFMIKDSKQQGNIIEYRISVVLKGEEEPIEGEVHVTYRKESGDWKLAAVRGDLMPRSRRLKSDLGSLPPPSIN